MKTPAHSPGPWTVDGDDRPGMQWNNQILNTRGHAVCFMAHSGGKYLNVDLQNANLIAAAPELLAALQALLDEVDGCECVTEKQAVAAIAKAMGGAA